MISNHWLLHQIRHHLTLPHRNFFGYERELKWSGMFSPEYEKRLLKHCSPTARRLFSASESSSPSDRFIPCRYVNIAPQVIRQPKCFVFSFSRGNNNWETNYSILTKSNENSSQSNKKQRECGEGARDSLAYSCLLKNELLGTSIEDIKNVSDDKMGCLSTSNRGLFKYQQPARQVSIVTSRQLMVCQITKRA